MISSKFELIESLKVSRLQEHTAQNVELKQTWDIRYGSKLSFLGNKIHNPCGWMIIGIKDNGEMAGWNEAWAKQMEEVISQHLNEKLEPIQSCRSLTCYEQDNSWAIIIEIINPGDVVYWDKQAYGGSGSTQCLLEPPDILKLRIQLPGLEDYTSQNVEGIYDRSLLESFSHCIAQAGHTVEFDHDPLTTLNKLGINFKQTSRILFGNCRFRIVKFKTLNEIESNVTKRGLFTLLTEDLQNEIQRWTAAQSFTIGNPYPSRSLREAFANAVAHAAYYERDGEIILELYPEKLCISNLCFKECALFANKWFSRSHKTFNGILMEVLRIAGKVDELGRGKHLIMAESIINGKMFPEVVIENAGRYIRWKLWLYGGTSDVKQVRLLNRIREYYGDDQKALIAFALILWRSKPVSDIRNYIDGDFSRQFADVLSDLYGPIYYYKEKDTIVLNRWASILLGEGLDSKKLSPEEESRLKKLAYDLQTKYHDGFVTPKEIRKLADMRDTKSEITLSSNLLSKWHREGILEKKGKGRYRFLKMEPIESNYQYLLGVLQAFQKSPTNQFDVSAK